MSGACEAVGHASELTSTDASTEVAASQAAPGRDFVLDGSLTCAWCFADKASAEAWAPLERWQTAEAHVPALWL